MRAEGNADVRRCAENLLATVRGEVAYERLKGLDARVIDKPADEAAALLQQDAAWLLETYEPRAIVNGITVLREESSGCDFKVTADIEEAEE